MSCLAFLVLMVQIPDWFDQVMILAVLGVVYHKYKHHKMDLLLVELL